MFGANGKCIKQSKASRAPDSMFTLAAVVHHYLTFNLVHAFIELLFFFFLKSFSSFKSHTTSKQQEIVIISAVKKKQTAKALGA